MLKVKQMILLLALLLNLLAPSQGLWTKFDFVRPWSGAWGSEGNRSFTKISGRDVGNGPSEIREDLSSGGA